MRLLQMPVLIETLRKLMKDAVLSLDLEEAKRCRDMINVKRGGATAAEAERTNFAGLEHQRPGAMGLGTNQQQVTPPAEWRPPPKSDPMTGGCYKRGERRNF
jgi:hypothetical protein